MKKCIIDRDEGQEEMINIAICDDKSEEREFIRNLLMLYANKCQQYEIEIYEFAAPLELLTYISKHGGFDVLLLDIYMPGILGTEVARDLRKLGDDCEIIFITTSREHAVEAFEVNASQYLVKPYTKEKLFLALDKVFQRISIARQNIITFKTSEGITRIDPQNVVFTETGRNNYQIIHTIKGEMLEVRMTSKNMFELLCKNKSFIRCGASISLNLKYVRKISKDCIIFDTGTKLSYPYRAYKELKEAFLNFQMDIDN